MHITKEEFLAALKGKLPLQNSEEAWHDLERLQQGKSSFDLVNVAYYFGATIVILAMTGLMTLGWQWYGGKGIFALALIYFIGFLTAGYTIWHKDNMRIPGGLLFTLAVFMTPLAVYGLQSWMGWWPGEGYPGQYVDFFHWIKGGWVPMEIATIIIALIVLYFVRFPFLMFPLTMSLWFLSMDIADLVMGRSFWWQNYHWMSMGFGAILMFVGFILDRRTREDFSFCLYFFGLIAFNTGMTWLWMDGHGKKLISCLISTGFILLSILLNRQIFVVFGALGVFGYLCYLAYDVFRDSQLFPVILSFLGIGIMYLGIVYQRNRQRIEKIVMGWVPSFFRRFLPR